MFRRAELRLAFEFSSFLRFAIPSETEGSGFWIPPKINSAVPYLVLTESPCREQLPGSSCANLHPFHIKEEQMSQQEHDLQMDYIEFPATDIEATKSFYGQVFGWKFTDYGPEYTSFNDGRMSGGFNAEAHPAGASLAQTHGTLVVIYAAALEKTYDKVKAAGGKIVRETFAFPGGRRFHFSDPNGNELAVWSE